MKTSDSYLELLFENRNKSYGAYELRTHYNDRLLKAFGMALVFAALVFLIPFVLTLIFSHPRKIADVLTTTVMDLQKTFVIEKPETHISLPPLSHTVAANSFRIVRRVEPVEKKEETKKDNTESNPSNTTGPVENTTTNTSTSTTNPPLIIPEPNPVMNAAAVDVAPVFPGGDKALMRFLEKNIHFPAFARENNITGKVFAGFVINEKGEVVNIEIKRSVENGLDDEVVRVLKFYHGNPVKTAMVLPVSFNIAK